MSIFIELFCLAVAIWYVPRYLCRVYGIDVMSILSGFWMREDRNETSSNIPVLPQQNQEYTEVVLDFPGVLTYLSEHNLSDDQLIDALALLRRANGDLLLSANKIRDTVGGADAIVKARVAARRPRPITPGRTRPGRLERPVNGW